MINDFMRCPSNAGILKLIFFTKILENEEDIPTV